MELKQRIEIAKANLKQKQQNQSRGGKVFS